MTTLGDAGGSPAVEVYQKKEGDPSYLITFCLDGSRIEDVYIDELPSLMQWLRDYTPFLLLEQLAYELGELRILGTKAFRTWHQHDYVGVCPNCDPEGWRRLQEYRQKRLQKKARE